MTAERTGLLKKALILSVFSVVFITLSTSIALKKSNTWDESAHILAGYAYLTEGMDYLSPLNHPVTGRAVTALIPALALGLEFNTAVRPEEAVDSDFFPYSLKFLFENTAPGNTVLFLARLSNILLGALLGIYVFLWGEDLWGTRGGYISLFFYLLSPNILAHSSLATTDIPVTAFFFISSYYLYRASSDRAAYGRVLLAALFAALALTSKHTALLLFPIALLSFSMVSRREGWKKASVAALIFFVTVYIVIWALYGFRFQSPSPLYAHLRWERFSSFALDPVFSLLRAVKVLPEAYLYSLEGTIAGSQSGRSAFLIGEYSTTGWWHYFIVAFLIKTPIPALILLIASVLHLAMDRDSALTALKYAIFPAVLVFTAVSMQRVNIGLRHALPAFPFVFLVIGYAARMKAASSRAARAVIAISVIWQIVSAVKIHPHELAYFNEFAGGPRNGYRYLVDSNLDWGQELVGLKEYMERNGIKRIKLSYFGFSDPKYYGIDYEYLPSYIMPAPAGTQEYVKLEGWFAISATMLQGVYLGDRNFYKLFRELEPIDTIGYSIFIYKL